MYCSCVALRLRSSLPAEKRRKALQERRLDREAEIEASLHIWDKEVVPDWRVVNSDPELRRLWWKGIPTKLRASMWEKAVGNSLSLSKGEYQYVFSFHSQSLPLISAAQQVDSDLHSSLLFDISSTLSPTIYINESRPLSHLLCPC